MKHMQRRIVLSSTYSLGSLHVAESATVDLDNRLQWRTNVRRLEAEPLRDAILAVSGQLDTTMGGSLLHVKNREYFFDHTSLDATNYDSPRRSIYLPVVRNHLYDVFSLFDYSDASVTNGDRPTSTVAPQALFMMNSQFLLAACTALAEQLLSRDAQDERQRIQHLYEHVIGRPASDDEIDQAEQFLRQFAQTVEPTSDGTDQTGTDQTGTDSWAAFCHILIASNEFIYLR